MGNATVDARKAELRAHFKKLRRELAPAERERMDAGITAAIYTLPEYEMARVILPYLSVGDEVNTRDIIMHAWADGKKVAIPRVVPGTRDMDFYFIDSFDDLEISSFNIEEPRIDPDRLLEKIADEGTLVIVPALTFDAAGYRLGYGGGFYDTLLASYEGASVGICREVQFSDDLAAEGILDAHDRPVGAVVTETRVIRPA